MSKKINTVLFILGATLFNIFVTVLAFLLLLFVYGHFFMNLLPDETQAWSFPLLFIAAILISFFVYRFALGLLMKKIEMERYFGPLFSSRRKG